MWQGWIELIGQEFSKVLMDIPLERKRVIIIVLEEEKMRISTQIKLNFLELILLEKYYN